MTIDRVVANLYTEYSEGTISMTLTPVNIVVLLPMPLFKCIISTLVCPTLKYK
jgi:hypothetical protein